MSSIGTEATAEEGNTVPVRAVEGVIGAHSGFRTATRQQNEQRGYALDRNGVGDGIGIQLRHTA